MRNVLATAAPELISVAEKEHLAVDCLTKKLRLLATLKPMHGCTFQLDCTGAEFESEC